LTPECKSIGSTPDFRRIVDVTVGVGPHFAIGVNCGIAVETRPAKNGTVVRFGQTDLTDGIARGRCGTIRLLRSPGRWHTPVEIGTRIFKGFVVGHLDDQPVPAPIDGVLRGLVRDSTLVPAGVKLLEIDAHGRTAQWTGTDQRGRANAEATATAIRLRAVQPVPTVRPLGSKINEATIASSGTFLHEAIRVLIQIVARLLDRRDRDREDRLDRSETVSTARPFRHLDTRRGS
jgi:hypothetical protein